MEITRQQRQIHVSAEAVGVLAIAPYLAHLASQQRQLTRSERAWLRRIAIGTALVDGYLLYRYLR